MDISENNININMKKEDNEVKESLSVNDDDYIKVKLTRSKFILVYLIIIFALTMANLDTTIISTALPRISKEFKIYESYTWIITSYMLTNTAIQPMCGKLADIFSSRSLMIISFIIFTLSSLICGFAPNMSILIIGRSIQGIGGGGICTLAFILISDITPISKRGIFMSINGILYTVATVIGPLLGGYFTDHLTWRWSFFINLPIGIICLVIFALFFKDEYKSNSLVNKIKRIDFFGIFSIVACLICILLALNWGGTKYSWGSSFIIILFCIGFVFLILYIIIEYKFAEEPITPLFLFKYRNISFPSITNFLEGYVISIFINTLPLFYQDGRHISATNAGLRLIPISMFYSCTAMASGYFIGKVGHIGMFIKYGCFFACIATYLITLIDINTPYYIEFLIFTMYGLSTGLIYQNCILVAQHISPPKYLSISTTICSFSNYIGSVVGIAIYGAFLQNIYPITYRKNFPNSNPVTINDIHSVPYGDVIYAKSIKKTYLYSSFPVGILIFLVALLIKDYKLNLGNNSRSFKDSEITLREDDQESSNNNEEKIEIKKDENDVEKEENTIKKNEKFYYS